MGFEELVEQLKGARGVLVRDRERIDDEINRVDAAVLRCADCGWECGTDKAANLDLHCRGTHRRPATTAERTPVAAA